MKQVRLPSFIQVESAECGAASLKILLEYYGSLITINTSKNTIGIGRDGSTGREICSAAGSFGLTLLPQITSYAELKSSVPPPYIMFWSSNHWLVVEGFDQKYMYASDPAKGRVRYPDKVAEDNFSKLILLPIDFDESFKKSENTDPNANLLSLFLSYKSSLGASLIIAIFSLVPEIAFSLVLGSFTENIATQNVQAGVLNQSWFLLFLSGLFFLFVFTRFYILRLINKSILLRASKYLVSRLLSAPLLFYSVRSSGELSDRVVRLTNQFNSAFTQLIPGVFSILRALLCIVVLFFINHILASYCTAVFAITAVIIYFASQVSIRDSAVNQTYLSRCLGILVDIVKSAELVKSTGTESTFFQRWAGNFAQYISASQNVSISNANVASLIQLSNYALSLGILFVSAYLIIGGTLTLASYTAFLYLATIISLSLGELPAAISSFALINGFKWRLNDTIELEPDPYSSISKLEKGMSISEQSFADTHAVVFSTDSVHPHILSLHDIAFYFPGCKKPVFSNLNYSFTPNSFTSVVGPSGSGKSTLAKIVAGLIHPQHGHVSISGIPLDHLPLSMAHSFVSYVPQDPFLFRGSLYDNLTLFDTSLTRKSVEKAIKLTDLFNRLNIKSDLETFQISDRGTNLSGGQRQLIEIARALIRQPKILILDEATSGFDNGLETYILDALLTLEISVISIAHRKTALRYSSHYLDLSQFIPKTE